MVLDVSSIKSDSMEGADSEVLVLVDVAEVCEIWGTLLETSFKSRTEQEVGE